MIRRWCLVWLEAVLCILTFDRALTNAETDDEGNGVRYGYLQTLGVYASNTNRAYGNENLSREFRRRQKSTLKMTLNRKNLT